MNFAPCLNSHVFSQAFLGMFVDDSVTGGNVRRRSATEDDNPPSPVMDNIDVFNITQSHPSTGSPGQRQRTDVSVLFAEHLKLAFGMKCKIIFKLSCRTQRILDVICCDRVMLDVCSNKM